MQETVGFCSAQSKTRLTGKGENKERRHEQVTKKDKRDWGQRETGIFCLYT